jgi:TonB-linked SusC/RagA family outer membrane protein
MQKWTVLILGLSFGLNMPTLAQSLIEVIGRVYNEQGVKLAGVELTYYGRSTVRVQSDTSGFFSFKTAENGGRLQVIYPGMETLIMPLQNHTVLELHLKPRAIAIGYGLIPNGQHTLAIAQVSNAQINRLPLQSTAYLLQGLMPGVDVIQPSARPGNRPILQIRGRRALGEENAPLYVIDGFPVSNRLALDGLNPADVQSVEVLKDAAASAVYGFRGSNGVILIHTRRAEQVSNRLSYQSFFGLAEPLAPTQMMTGAEFAEYQREANRIKGGTYTTPFPNPAQDFSLFEPVNWEAVASAYTWEDQARLIPKYRPATAAEKAYYANWNLGDVDQIPIYDPTKVRTTDWGSLVLQTGQKQNHHLSYSLLDGKYSSIFSLGYYNEVGLQRGQGFEQTTAHLALNYRGTQRFTWGMTTKIGASQQNWGVGIYEQAIQQNPLTPAYTANGQIIQNLNNDPTLFNPLLSIAGEIDDRDVFRVLSNFFTEIELAKGLHYRLNLAADFGAQSRGIFQFKNTNIRRGGFNFASHNQTRGANLLYESVLHYDKNWSKQHALNITTVHAWQYDRTSNDYLEGINFSDQFQSADFLRSNAQSTQITGRGTIKYKDKLHSGLLRVNYGWQNRYFVSGVLRYDDPEFIPMDVKNRWNPALSLAWKIHEEPFLQSSGFQELKLRIGYGQTGRNALPYIFTSTGIAINHFRNHTVNIGLDFEIWSNHFKGSVDVYQSRAMPRFSSQSFPPPTGIITNEVNIYQNAGIELGLTSQVLQSKNWQWNMELVLSKNQEKTFKVDSALNSIGIGGDPKITFFAWNVEGIWSTSEASQAAGYSRSPGQIKYADLNQDGKIDLQDRTVQGSDVPDFTGSLFNAWTYKNWELAMFWFARVGQVLPNQYYSPLLDGRYTEAQFIANQYWTPGRQDNVQYPRPDKNQNSILGHSLLYQDGSFAKLRMLSLHYHWSEVQLQKTRLSNLSLYLTVYNPLLIAKVKITDPEHYIADLFSGNSAQRTNLSDRSLMVGLKMGLR